jgi:hypothetical protein
MHEGMRYEDMKRREDPARTSGAGTVDPDGRDSVLDRVRGAVEGIRFGEVRLIIQDGVIVQIDRVEKERLR